MLRGDQSTAQSCYVSSLCKDTVPEVLNIEEMDPKEQEDRVSLVEELTQLTLDPQFPDWVVSIGSLLKHELCERLVKLLR